MSSYKQNGTLIAYSLDKGRRAAQIDKTEVESAALLARYGTEIPWGELWPDVPARALIFTLLCLRPDGLTTREIMEETGLTEPNVGNQLDYMRDLWFLVEGPGPLRRRARRPGVRPTPSGVWKLNRGREG